MPGRRQWHPTPVLSPGKSHGRRSLVGRSPWGLEESDTTERLHFPFSPSCIGEGNGDPLQCSCLENPRDGGAWWAAVYGVALCVQQQSGSSRGCGPLLQANVEIGSYPLHMMLTIYLYLLSFFLSYIYLLLLWAWSIMSDCLEPHGL